MKNGMGKNAFVNKIMLKQQESADLVQLMAMEQIQQELLVSAKIKNNFSVYQQCHVLQFLQTAF